MRARKINGAYSQIGTARHQIRPNENSTMAQVIAHYVNPVLSGASASVGLVSLRKCARLWSMT